MHGQPEAVIVATRDDSVFCEVDADRICGLVVFHARHAYDPYAIEVHVVDSVLRNRHRVDKGGEVGRRDRSRCGVDHCRSACAVLHDLTFFGPRVGHEQPRSVVLHGCVHRSLWQEELVEVGDVDIGNVWHVVIKPQRCAFVGRTHAKHGYLLDGVSVLPCAIGGRP